MNFIPYKFYIYLHLIFSLVLLPLPFIFNQNSNSKVLTIIAIFIFTTNLLASNLLKINFINLTPRISILINFLFGTIISFTPYLFNFTEQTNLVVSIYILSFLSLITLFFTQINQEEQE